MKNPNIILINPPIYDFAAFDLWLKPLGLLYIAAFLEQFGYKVSVIDALNRHHPSLSGTAGGKELFDTGHFPYETAEKPAYFKDVPRRYKRYGLSRETLIAEIKKYPNPLLIGVTCTMTYWYKGAFEMLRLAKELHPHAHTALGGIYASLFPLHAAAHSGADSIIEKDGRLPMLRLADTLSGTQRNYSRIDLALDSNPYPAYHLIENLRSVSVTTSLGCPYRCTYCASGFLYPKYERRRWEKVYEELLYYRERFNIKDIAFYDDALLHDSAAHIKPLLERLVREKVQLRFHLPNGIHTRLLDEELAHLFFRSGFKTLRLSFESSDRDIQEKNSDSKTTNSHLKKAIRLLTEAGYKNSDIEVYILLGLPNQDIKDITDTIKFVHSAGAIVKTAQYSPIPHTKDFEKVMNINSRIKEEPLYTNNTIFPVVTGTFSFAQYQEIKDLARALNERLRNS